MALLTSSSCWRSRGSPFFNSHPAGNFCRHESQLFRSRASDDTSNVMWSSSAGRFHGAIKALGRRNSGSKSRGRKEEQKNATSDTEEISSLSGYVGEKSGAGYKVYDGAEDSSFAAAEEAKVAVPSRSSILQACVVTSGLIAALGFVIRQVSHGASSQGLPILDCSTLVSFNFEIWHLELITGLVILISSSRYLLLKAWPDFAESSETANRQVLMPLESFDYLIVAFLPGISEELLFRGALLPLFGLDWKSAFAVGVVFGALHLGSGRKYPFAIWATFVGLAYGYATIMSSSVVVPMASHALNNIIGALLWHHSSRSSDL